MKNHQCQIINALFYNVKRTSSYTPTWMSDCERETWRARVGGFVRFVRRNASRVRRASTALHVAIGRVRHVERTITAP